MIDTDRERERFERLPKWAQNRITLAERDTAYWRSKAENGPEESNTFVHGYNDQGGLAGTPLGTGTDIRFEFDPETYILARMTSRGLELLGTERRGSGGLILRFMSQNMACAQVGDDR